MKKISKYFSKGSQMLLFFISWDHCCLGLSESFLLLKSKMILFILVWKVYTYKTHAWRIRRHLVWLHSEMVWCCHCVITWCWWLQTSFITATAAAKNVSGSLRTEMYHKMYSLHQLMLCAGNSRHIKNSSSSPIRVAKFVSCGCLCFPILMTLKTSHRATGSVRDAIEMRCLGSTIRGTAK